MADDDIIRGGLDIVTDKEKKNKPKAEQETAQPTAARFNKPKAEQETAQPTAARFNEPGYLKSAIYPSQCNVEKTTEMDCIL